MLVSLGNGVWPGGGEAIHLIQLPSAHDVVKKYVVYFLFIFYYFFK